MSVCVFKAWIKINLVNNNDNCYHITSVVYDNRQLMFYWFSNHNRSVYIYIVQSMQNSICHAWGLLLFTFDGHPEIYSVYYKQRLAYL